MITDLIRNELSHKQLPLNFFQSDTSCDEVRPRFGVMHVLANS